MARGRADGDALAQLRRDLSEGHRPYYLLHGENHWLRVEALRVLRDGLVPAGSDEFSFEERRLERHADWAEVEAALREFSFFGGHKFIHLEVEGSLGEDTRAALSSFLDEEPGQNILCLSAPNLTQLTAAKNRIVKRRGLVLKFEALKGAALRNWTADRLKSAGIEYEREVPDLLGEFLDGEQGRIAGEIEKLKLMPRQAAAGHKLGSEELRRLLGGNRGGDVWELASAIRPDNEAALLLCLAHVLDGGGQNTIALIGALTYSLMMILRARFLLDSGLPPARAAGALPIYPSRAREYVDQASSLTRRQLLAFVFNLQKLDHRLKSGSGERERELLETTLLESLAGRYLPN